MFSGAQFSLYPMTGDFVPVILSSLSALDPYRERLRIETDDLSTLIVGPADDLFPAMRDLHGAASRDGVHCVLSAAVSRGCPGEPDDPRCTPLAPSAHAGSMDERIAAALAAVEAAPETGLTVAAQFSFYPLGAAEHMDEIYACIDFVKRSGVFGRAKNFCTRLDGDAGRVFATLGQAFVAFGAPQAHVALDVTVSANSPSRRG
ncbi:Ykof family thiamine-binding protein [Aquibium sp. A9E412]|uniref:YkoF family thiamine/hydroxymethylpyrimidine-binding protein n=1 Tax=Aquibium sp. A9E412 TaxID=2976767 RepID=UPI0025B15810|nr:YkoF family thiamine/hydroxymethylpyrimidine-binding protein [Aquibium sp. A9E412]MDN2564686.1 Ykof family thiamine-binding protein [Aquibium sp. A9E412]